MGVKGLYSYLRPYRHAVNINTIPKGLIGVDALSVLYKFRGNTDAIMAFLAPFMRMCPLLFVFDGKAPDSKKMEIDERKTKRNTAREEADTLRAFLDTDTALEQRDRRILERKIHILENGAWSMTRQTRHTFQDVLREKNIAFVKAKGGADDLLMSLWADQRLVGIISTDMDFLLAGVERLWIPSASAATASAATASAATATATTKPPPPEEITLSAVLEQEELSMHSFQDAAILCGVSSAYCFSNMYPHKAFTFMRHYGSLEALYERPPALFTNIPLETLQEVRSRFRILVQPEELVREEYRSVLDEFKRPSEHPKQNT